jgi:predicted dehydrogenase
MMKNLRLGVIGAGAIMRERHWPNLKKIPGVSISCVCNSTTQSAERFVKENEISADVVEDWKELIGRSDVDVVWVAAPPLMHKPAVIDSLQVKKPVFCQARMAMNYAEAREMREAHLKTPDVVAAFCPAPFGMSVSKYIKKILSEEILGKLIHLDFKALSNVYSDPDSPAHWRQREDINGINFLSCGIFAEVIMDWLGEPQKLCATGGVVHKQRGPHKITLPDIASVKAVWRDDLNGDLLWSGVHFLNQRPSLTIQGTKACLQVLFQPDEVYLSEDRNSTLKKVTIPEEFLTEWRVEQNFIDAVRGASVKPGISFEEGLRYMKFTQAVIDSLENNGTWINLV